MATPRRNIVSYEEVGIYHCLSSCVRRALLCGRDPVSGKNYSHRRDFIHRKLKDLATHFCLPVISSSIEPNHFHVIIKLDPSASAHLKPEEVVRRWRRILPHRRDKKGNPVELSDDELLRELANPFLVAEWRHRLINLSWFMRCLKEPIARLANREDNCKGHFWEQRFHCIRIEDTGALLTCMAYVDLNSVRSGETDRPEYCQFAGIRDRINACKARHMLEISAEYEKVFETKEEARRMMSWALRQSKADEWMCALEEVFEGWNGYEGGIGEQEYLTLMDNTGRKLRDKDRGNIPAELAPILERMELDVENWVKAVEEYGGMFHVYAGNARRLRELAKKLGKRCLWGVNLKVQMYRAGVN